MGDLGHRVALAGHLGYQVDTLAAPLQVKLLRAVQEKSFKAVGDTRDISVDIRIITATNRNLEAAVTAKTFKPRSATSPKTCTTACASSRVGEYPVGLLGKLSSKTFLPGPPALTASPRAAMSKPPSLKVLKVLKKDLMMNSLPDKTVLAVVNVM